MDIDEAIRLFRDRCERGTWPDGENIGLGITLGTAIVTEALKEQTKDKTERRQTLEDR